MADKFCRQCGAPLLEGEKKCRYCLTPVAAEEGAAEKKSGVSLEKGSKTELKRASDGWKEKDFEKEEHKRVVSQQDRVYALLAYLGFMVLAPILMRLRVRFVRFHVNQGLVLFLSESLLSVVYGFVGGIPILAMIVSLLRLLCVGFMIFGAVSAVRGSEKSLPIVGKIHLIRES